MLCRVYTCWMPARRSSHIWSRPICLSPWGFWVLFDDIVEPLVLSSPYRTMSSPSCSGERWPPGSSPRLISVLTRSVLRVRSPSGSGSSASGSRSSVVRWDAVPLCTPGWRCLPLLQLKDLALLTGDLQRKKVKKKKTFGLIIFDLSLFLLGKSYIKN